MAALAVVVGVVGEHPHGERRAADPPFFGMNFTQIVESWGYPCEEHHAQTPDGYILTLFRIPPKSSGSLNRPPVLLQHGLLDSSFTYAPPPFPLGRDCHTKQLTRPCRTGGLSTSPSRASPTSCTTPGTHAPKAAATQSYASTTHSECNCLMPPGLTCGWGTTEATSTRSSTSTSLPQTICSGTFRGT
jgi:hypothetical protein